MNKRKRYLIMMICAGLIFGICFGIGSGLTSLIVNHMAEADEQPQEVEEEILERQDGERTNILVLGVDARPGETTSRSDTMILVSVDPKLNKAAVVSIPRDTKVTIKGATEKICAANVLGGPELAVSTVEDLMGIKIDYWVEMDFNGFKKIVDTLGGVTITVPQRMYKPSEGIDLQPGTKKLNGSEALAFVRFRDYNMGDIDRTSMQQEFIKALAKEVLQPKTITKLPKLIKDLNQYVETNMKVTDMLRIASWAPGFSTESIIAQTLPGSFYDEVDENGYLLNSYWQVDKKQIASLLETMFEGKTVAVVQNTIKNVVPSANGSSTKDEDISSQDGYISGDDEAGNRDKKTDRMDIKDDPVSPEQNLPQPGSGEQSSEDEPESPPASPSTQDFTGPEGYVY